MSEERNDQVGHYQGTCVAGDDVCAGCSRGGPTGVGFDLPMYVSPAHPHKCTLSKLTNEARLGHCCTIG